MALRLAQPARKSPTLTVSSGTPFPDAATAAAALQSGEVDWWEQPTTDLLPLLRKNPDVTVDIIDTLGYQAVLRFNHLYPPFDNVGHSPGPAGGI